MQDAMDELIIAGTSSLHWAIKSIQCLRQHDLPHHTWHTSPCLGKPSPCVGKHDVLLISGVDPGFGQGGPQLLRLKIADIAKRSRASEASILRPGSKAHLRALEAFGVLMLKYAFSHILETLFLLFLTSILTPKVDKKRALDFTSINLRHSDMLHLFFNLHEKVML